MYISRKKRIFLVGALTVVLLFFAITPARISNSTSTVLFDRNEALLSACVAADGMWRFPNSDTIPYKFKTCLLQFEDEYFMYHLGFNPISACRALVQNLKSRSVVSGASTITMQLVRLSRGRKSRTYFEKFIEIVIAIRTEFALSKKSILSMYASNAPFGGNVVGVDAAAWRYFGSSVDNLSWAEAASLAVLPNAPGLVFPGRNQHLLLKKRNRLLLKLRDNGIIDQETYQLSLLEPLPNPTKPLPQDASLLLTRCINDGYRGKSVLSTIDKNIQVEVQSIALDHYGRFLANGIKNAAVMVVDNTNGEVLAYVGNIHSNNPEYSSRVDIISSRRSYGSLLKPFLYGFMLTEGLILPRQLVDDTPVAFAGFTPKNFYQSFEGVVHVNEAISRSLNVPAVNLLQDYGVEKFCNNLNNIGFISINRTPDYYGLSIILGGAEATMWELTGAYSALCKKANGISRGVALRYVLDSTICSRVFQSPNIGVGSAYLTLEALTQAVRPDEGGTLRYFTSPQKIAWKTGTSRGFRDAWAIGVTPKYTVSVWVGNADGEGRAELVGVSMAAPVMFEVFSRLPVSSWFQKPIYDLQTVRTCKQSGLLASANCDQTNEEDVPIGIIKTPICGYHHKVFLDKKSGKRVTLSCARPDEIEVKNWFVLPPVQEWFYSKSHPDYLHLPQFRDGCAEATSGIRSFDLIYPYAGADIYLPNNADNTRGSSIWSATHRDLKASIYWHLNNQFLGKTTGNHIMPVSQSPGEYILTLVDDRGEMLKRKIRIIGDDK